MSVKVRVSVRNVKTGKVIHYPTMAACTSAYNLKRGQLYKRIADSEDRVWPEGNQYRTFRIDSKWGSYSHVNYTQVSYFKESRVFKNNKAVEVLNISRARIFHDDYDHSVTRYISCTEAAEHFGVSLAKMSAACNDPTQPVVVDCNNDLYLVKFVNPFVKWRIVEDPFTELKDRGFTKPVQVTTVTTYGVNKASFMSIKEAAKAHDVSYSTVIRLIKSGKQRQGSTFSWH